MIKIRRIDSFLERGRFVIKMKNNASTLTKLKKFHENQEFKIMKNKSLNFLKLHIMNIKIH